MQTTTGCHDGTGTIRCRGVLGGSDPGGSHGLENRSEEDLRIIVIGVIAGNG